MEHTKVKYDSIVNKFKIGYSIDDIVESELFNYRKAKMKRTKKEVRFEVETILAEYSRTLY